jgi:hypothetical protein
MILLTRLVTLEWLLLNTPIAVTEPPTPGATHQPPHSLVVIDSAPEPVAAMLPSLSSHTFHTATVIPAPCDSTARPDSTGWLACEHYDYQFPGAGRITVTAEWHGNIIPNPETWLYPATGSGMRLFEQQSLGNFGIPPCDSAWTRYQPATGMWEPCSPADTCSNCFPCRYEPEACTRTYIHPLFAPFIQKNSGRDGSTVFDSLAAGVYVMTSLLTFSERIPQPYPAVWPASRPVRDKSLVAVPVWAWVDLRQEQDTTLVMRFHSVAIDPVRDRLRFPQPGGAP